MGLDRAPVFLALSLLAELVGTVGGFGSSVCFVPIVSFTFDFQNVLGITATSHLVSNLSKLGLFRTGIDARLLLGMSSVAFALRGALATPYQPTEALKAALAVILIVFSGLLLWRSEWQLKPHPWAAVIGGATGVVSTGGAARAWPWLLSTRPRRCSWPLQQRTTWAPTWPGPGSSATTASSGFRRWSGSRCWPWSRW